MAADFGAEEPAMQAYFREGERRAMALANRGPVRFGADGKLDPGILDTYRRMGFYILENVLDPEELAELKSDLLDLLERLPSSRGSPLDRYGRPALGADSPTAMVSWSKPLGDPMGATDYVKGRAPVKMIEPQAAPGLPAETPYMILGPLQFSDAALRVYGHPKLLGVAASINGDDFVPFSEAIIFKKPGEGASFAWHQDGVTHWENPAWTPESHGFNFMVQIFPCTAANAVWYVPGSHARGRADIRALVDRAGGNRLPDATPLICGAGDVAISNRQIVHGSFPNTSADWRMTLNMGFHRRESVVGVETIDQRVAHECYDEAWVEKRAEMIGRAIDARCRHFPDEAAFSYAPHVGKGARHHRGEAARADIAGYQHLDLRI